MSCAWEAIIAHLSAVQYSQFILNWCWPVSDTGHGLATNGSGSDLCSHEETTKGMKFCSSLIKECIMFLHYKVLKDRLEKCSLEYFIVMG